MDTNQNQGLSPVCFNKSFNNLSKCNSKLFMNSNLKRQFSSDNLPCLTQLRPSINEPVVVGVERLKCDGSHRHLFLSSPVYSTYSVRLVKWPSTSDLVEIKPVQMPSMPDPTPPLFLKSIILPSEDRLNKLDAHALEVRLYRL